MFNFMENALVFLLFQDFGLLLFFDFGCLGLHFEEHARFDQGANQQTADHHSGRRRLCRTANGARLKNFNSRTSFYFRFFAGNLQGQKQRNHRSGRSNGNRGLRR
jgi:hypothetical protein